MSLDILLTFLAIVAVSTYFQTITGFGLGMIVMGAASGLDLLPVAVIAAVNSLLSLANSAFALPGALHHVNWRITRPVLYGMLPAIFAGMLLLHYLGPYSQILKLLLGIVIIYGGVSVAVHAAPGAQKPTRGVFVLTGMFSGALAGLFGMAGPPLVYQFYRQNLSLQAIRYSLIFLFTMSAGVRTLVVAGQGQLNYQILMLGLLSLPVGALATLAGKRYPPPLGHAAMRRIASLVLVAIGLSLIWPAMRMWMAGRG